MRQLLLFLFALGLLLAPLPVKAQEDYELSYLLVRRADGQVLEGHQAEKLRTPASTMKLLTAAAALETLGPEHRYRTALFSNARPERRLRGDLALRGEADPELRPEHLEGLAGQLAELGVRQIEGDLVLDEGPFADPPYGPGWAWDDAGESYAPEVSALAVNGGLLSLPEGFQAPWLRVRPGDSSTVRLIPGREGVELLGPPPRQLAPPRAAWHTGQLFVQQLRRKGIRLKGEVKMGQLQGQELATHHSRRLREILGEALSVSDNRAMELIHRSCGQALPTVLEGQRLRRADGSGLSRYNLVSARQLVDVLLDQPELSQLLPGGGEGTLSRRFLQGPAAGQVRAKTGTLGNVSGLAGYLFPGTPEECVFAILINGHVDSTTERKAIEDALVEGWAAAHRAP